MTTLEKTLVHYGLFILWIYIVGLTFPSNFSEDFTKTVFYSGFIFFLLFRLVTVKEWKLPKMNWPALGIWLVSLSLILPLALRGDHILGVDAHREFYAFMQSDLNNEVYTWEGGLVASCLSITILPTVFQDVTSIEHEALFKILYPLLFSIFPIIVYLIAKRFVPQGYAFLAGIAVTLQPMFLWTTANARTSIGILFIALILMVIFSKIEDRYKFIYIVLLGTGCTLSHYVSVVVLITLLISLILFKEFRWIVIGSLPLVILITYLWQVHSGLVNHWSF